MDLPWSMWAMMEKLRMLRTGSVLSDGYEGLVVKRFMGKRILYPPRPSPAAAARQPRLWRMIGARLYIEIVASGSPRRLRAAGST